MKSLLVQRLQQTVEEIGIEEDEHEVRLDDREDARDDELEQSRGALPKNLIRPLPYRIAKESGSGDLLSRPPVRAGKRDGVDYGGSASREDDKTLDWFSVYCGGSRIGLYIERLRKS
jgi:hypothetical protein